MNEIIICTAIVCVPLVALILMDQSNNMNGVCVYDCENRNN